MRLILSILNIIFFLAISLPAVAAPANDPAWRKARDSYDLLQKSPRQQKFRSEWDRVLLQFVQYYERNPNGTHAGEALFMAGKTLAGRYQVSRVADDAWEAVSMYDRLALDLPGSNLADDALLLAGELLEKALKAPEEAWLRYQQVVTQFPTGDMTSQARARLKALDRYAPPPPSSAAPASALSTAAPPGSSGPVGTVTESRLAGIRFWSNPGYTRVVLDLSAPAPFTTNFLPADPVENLPPRLFLDIAPATLDPVLRAPTIVDDGLLRRVRTGVPEGGKVRVVLDLNSIGQHKIFPLNDPYRIVIDISGEKIAEIKALEPSLHAPPGPPVITTTQPESQPQPQPQPQPASGRDPIAKILDQVPLTPPPATVAPVMTTLRRIVVDPGHGGKDPGAIGPNGVREKDVNLAIARKLASKLRETLACDVVLTRDSDIYLPLEERTAIANKVGADLFISIHANASTNRQAYGVETYYLNFSKNDRAAAVAARENGTSLKDVGDLELILFDLMANSKINESSRLAAEIQKALVEQLGGRFSDVRDLGVRQGPFYVLLGATMPSVLVETAFISHPREEQRLSSRDYQEQSAVAIATAVKNFALSHKLIAAR
jgi:N-acetylmuramoyl-L-alanine amidase